MNAEKPRYSKVKSDAIQQAMGIMLDKYGFINQGNRDEYRRLVNELEAAA